MRKQLLSAIMVAGMGIAEAGTWEKLSLWTDSFKSVLPRDCELTPNDSSIWIIFTAGGIPGRIDLATPTIRVAPNDYLYSSTDHYPIGLAINAKGKAFVGGHLGKIWKGTSTDFTEILSLPHGRTVNDLAFDVYGRLWAATDSLAWRFDGVAWTSAGVAADYGDNPRTTHLAADPRGGMWIGSEGKGLLLHKQGTFQKEFALSVRELQVMPSGTVLVGRHDKLARIPYGASAYEVIDHITNNPDVTDGWTNGAFEDPTGTLWIGNGGGIALKSTSQSWSTWVQPLANNESLSLFYRFLQASDGTLYACGDRATYRYSEKIALPAWPTPDPEFAGSSSSSPSSSSVTPSSSSAVPPSSSSATGGSSSSSSSERDVSSSSSTTTLAHRTEPQGFAMRATVAGVSLHVANGSVSLSVYNSAGVPVRSSTMYHTGSHNISMNNLSTGLYWVRAYSNGERLSLPVVVP